MVDTFVGYGNVAWLNDDFYVVKLSLMQQIHISNNAQMGDNLIRNVLHQAFAVVHTNDFLVVINTDVDTSTTGIGKTAYPFQILVTPTFLVFYVLAFAVLYLCHIYNNVFSSYFIFANVSPNLA